MKILRFDEFVNEGLWSKGINRSKTGEERLEDVNQVNSVCELVSKIISEKEKIPFNKDICTCVDTIEKVVGTSGVYVINFKYKNFDFDLNIGTPQDENFEEICVSFASTLGYGLGFYKNLPKGAKKTLEFVGKELVKIVKSDVNEGLWSKGFERSKTGEERIENKIQTNIETMDVVDIGHPIYVFADKDLEVEGEEMFVYKNYLEVKDYLNSKGWEIPETSDLMSCFVLDKLDYEVVEHDDDTYTISGTSNKTGETLSFTIDDNYRYMRYMCELPKNTKDKYVKSTCIGSWEISRNYKFNIFSKSSNTVSLFKIRLVKRKKPFIKEE